MSTYYHTCPYCGAHLDPGERCDCTQQKGGAAAWQPECRPPEPVTPADRFNLILKQLKEI